MENITFENTEQPEVQILKISYDEPKIQDPEEIKKISNKVVAGASISFLVDYDFAHDDVWKILELIKEYSNPETTLYIQKDMSEQPVRLITDTNIYYYNNIPSEEFKNQLKEYSLKTKHENLFMVSEPLIQPEIIKEGEHQAHYYLGVGRIKVNVSNSKWTALEVKNAIKHVIIEGIPEHFEENFVIKVL